MARGDQDTERCRAPVGWAAPLGQAPGAGRGEQRRGDSPLQHGPWPKAASRDEPRGKPFPLPQGQGRRERPRVAQRPSPAEGAGLDLLEAGALLSEGSVLPSVPAARLTCRPASYKPQQQAASELLRQLQASTWDSSSPGEEPSQGGDPK